ncbi:MAG TPA: MerR family transcriptional regulator [Gemmatimonadales bacterium]
MTGPLTIGRVAQGAGVNVETVRYYERRGLLAAPPRTAARYRQYPADAIRRIEFIKRAQQLGFTLEEIGDLLNLRARSERNCDAVLRQARHALDRIAAKAGELERMRRALVQLAEDCRRRKPSGECPILAALEEERS